MSGRYWVHVDHPTNHARVHEAGCPFCNDGRGVAEDKSDKEGEWHGPFEEASLAMKDAEASEKKDIQWCAHCARRLEV